MPRTVQDYADAVPLGPVLEPDYVLELARVDVRHVEARGARVVATMLWNECPHLLSHALLPHDVTIQGGNLPVEEAALDEWAKAVVVNLVAGADLPLLASRRTWNGRSIEIAEADEPDHRYVGRHLLGSAAQSIWDEAARHGHPVLPPSVVEAWREDGSLISWHYVTVHHTRVLPVFGHGAVRWVGDGAASVDHLDLSPGLPETFGVLTVADAMHRAAAAGAHTIACTVDVPSLELLGFRDHQGVHQVDSRFLDIDHEEIARFVLRTSDWRPPVYVQSAIHTADGAAYYAG